MWVPQWELIWSAETLHTSPLASPACIEMNVGGSPGQVCIELFIGIETSIHEEGVDMKMGAGIILNYLPRLSMSQDKLPPQPEFSRGIVGLALSLSGSLPMRRSSI